VEFTSDVDLYGELIIFAAHFKYFLIVNIFVGNLSWGVDDVALKETFEAHGAVDSARVIHDRETGRSRGFGFVEMPNSEEGAAAIEALEGKDVMGRPIRCNESEEREKRRSF
jgi:cold-inducible RNA-binding protein